MTSKSSIQSFLALTAAAAMIGCSNPADNVSEATVNEPAPKSAEPAAGAAAAAESTTTNAPASAVKSYVVNADSKIDFLASKAIGGETPGGFKKFVGQLNVRDGKLEPEGSRIVIDINSIHTEKPKLTAHLKNEDFFDVGKFPTATFAATKVSDSPDDSGMVKLTGDLTMHGVTQSITFPAKITVSDEKASVSAEFFINRFDFDMKYAGQADNLIRKEVVLKLDVHAAPGEADFAAL